MKIGIIGSGNIGSALTRLFRTAGHEVSVANSRGPASLAGLSQETGAHAATVEEAVQSDLVVVTIPLKEIPKLPQGLFASAPSGVIVVDTCNYYPQHRDGRIDAIEQGMPESHWVEEHLGRHVIKVFNSIYAAHLLGGGKPAGTPGRIALPVSGDDAAAKKVVTGLLNEIGFDAVDAGPIAESWRQQPGSPGYCKDFDVAGVRKALADAKPERTPEWRATPNSPGTFEQPA